MVPSVASDIECWFPILRSERLDADEGYGCVLSQNTTREKVAFLRFGVSTHR